MKVNYNQMMEETIRNLVGKPKLLLHACCGICSSSVLERLNPFFNITVLYYNPNTYPREEYIKRLDTLRELVEKMNLGVKILEIGYESEKFDIISKGLEFEEEGKERCTRCFYLRLEKTAMVAKDNKYDYFTTTLSVSPHKDSSKINKIGIVLEEKYGVKFLCSDFKKKDGFKRSGELSNIFKLYRQNYCGCRYSLNKVLKSER